MSVLCPHCRNPVDIAAVAAGETLCPSCGARFQLECGATTDWISSEHPRTLGKFELIDMVGAGAFGTVYRARDTELGRTVAVKVPRASNLGSSGGSERFLREARSVAQLRHPSIVPVFEIGQDSGLPYLVSEFVQGITLADLLTSEPPSARAAAKLVADIADALDYAHAQGVIHRDVKPSNIMLESRGKEDAPTDAISQRYIPRLMDFGLAKRDADEVTMTAEGQVLGTPAYMSPEQARGESHSVDGRSDVYSLGIIFYQLLTGELPFKGNARMLLHHVLHDDPKPLRKRNPNVPRDLETICLKAMAKEPARRYSTAGALAADLGRFLNGEPIQARPVGRAERTWRWCRRNPTVAGLGAAVIVLLGVLGGVTIRSLGPDRNAPTAPASAIHIEPDTSENDLLQIVAELDRTSPGWRLEEIEAKREVIPDDQNGALQIVAVDRILNSRRWPTPQSRELETVLFKVPPLVRLSDTEVSAIREEIQTVAPALSEAQKLAFFDTGRFPTDFRRDAISTLLPGAQGARNVARLLAMAAFLQIQENNQPQAWTSCRALLGTGRLIGDEPITIPQQVRMVCLRVAQAMFERLLAQTECLESELKTVQELIKDEVDYPLLLTCARGERGAMHWFLSSLAAGDVPLQSLFKDYKIREIHEMPDAMQIRRAHVFTLRYLTQWVELAKQPLEVQTPLLEDLEQTRATAPAGADTFVIVLGDQGNFGPSVLTASFARHQARLRTALAALAAERYRLAHGDWPGDLGALVPAYLQGIPNDPYDGQPLHFRQVWGGVVVYSLGPDRTDNEGNLDRTGQSPEGTDIGFQLWNVALRHQPPGGSGP